MKFVSSTCSMVLILSSLSSSVYAQEPQAPDSAVAVERTVSAEIATTVPEPQRFTGRLPRFFASLVDEVQRGKIYDVQRSYRSRIEQLESQLAALKQAEQAEMLSVLTPVQLERLEALRVESMNRLARSRASALVDSATAETRRPTAADSPAPRPNDK